MNEKYKDIIHLPRHVSCTHKHMSNIDRAAQFAPFAALTGHEEAICETARLTDTKVILDESQKEILNRKLRYIQDHLSLQIEISITYFVQDHKKCGGSYQTIKGIVRMIDEIENRIHFYDKQTIKIDDILFIESDILNKIVL